jgi:hypothetical protein
MFEDEFCINSYFFNKKIEKTIFFKEVMSLESLEIIREFKKVKIVEGMYVNEIVIDSIEMGNTRVHVIRDRNLKDWSIVITENNNQNLAQNSRTVYSSKKLSTNQVYEDAILTKNKDYLIITTRVYNSYADSKKRVECKYKVYNERVKTKIKINNYRFYLTIIDLKETNDKELNINSFEIEPIEDKFLKSCSVEEVGLDSILLTGVYAIGMNVNTKGVYSTILNFKKNNEVIISNYFKFSEDFIMKYKNNKEKEDIKLAISEGKPYDVFDYKNIKTIKLSEGGFVAILEKNNEYTTYVTSNVGNSYITTPVYNRYNSDLYLSYISPYGNITKVLKIPKKQVTTRLMYEKFKRTTLIKYIDNNIVILCNDYQKLNGRSARRLITFVVDENKNVIQDINPIYDTINKADFTLSDTWINRYKMISVAKHFENKRKIIITDFEYLLK